MVARYNLEMNKNLIPQLVKEQEYDYECDFLDNPEKIMNMLNVCMNLRYQCEERVVLFCCNTRLSPPHTFFEVAHGTSDTCMVTPKEILQRVLMAGALRFFLVHNHPSQNLQPSQVDIMFADQMLDASATIGVQMLDFLIVGDGYYSFKENQMLG